MFGLKKKPMRNDLLEAYEPKREQNAHGATLMAVAQVNVLTDEERVQAVLCGQVGEKSAVFILTDSRLLLLEGNILNNTVTTIETRHITGIKQHSTMLFGSVSVVAGSIVYTIDHTISGSHKRFVAALSRVQTPVANAAA